MKKIWIFIICIVVLCNFINAEGITDDFGDIEGNFPDLFSDNDDNTYVLGGLGASGWDSDGKFKLYVGDAKSLSIRAKVDCFSGGCGSHSGCVYYYKFYNKITGIYDVIKSQWIDIGVDEIDFQVQAAEQYIDSNNFLQILISFECNMDGKVLEFIATEYTTPSCGDGICSSGEECERDCKEKKMLHILSPRCGDGVCSHLENCLSCEDDFRCDFNSCCEPSATAADKLGCVEHGKKINNYNICCSKNGLGKIFLGNCCSHIDCAAGEECIAYKCKKISTETKIDPDSLQLNLNKTLDMEAFSSERPGQKKKILFL
jgi:hypothetical protein